MKPTKEQLAQFLREYPTWGHAAAGERARAERAEGALGELAEFARFVATLDDPRAVELRRSITLTEIIDRAKDALSRSVEPDGDE